MSNWAGKLVLMCLCKRHATAGDCAVCHLVFNRTPCLFEGGGTPEVASHFSIPARQEPSLRNQVTTLRARLLASRLKRRTRSPA